MSNLRRISQLTGFSDPIYAEAYVKMHGFDIMLGMGSFSTFGHSAYSALFVRRPSR